MKNFVTTILLSMAVALTANAYNVSGVVVDAEGEPMIRATVRLLNQADSSSVKGSLTDDDGAYKITDIKGGKYILETSYVGFDTYTQNIEVKKSVKLDPIVLRENAALLKDITVTGIKTPIKVMEDTIEFNADSYKTQPNAVVEDLLKRLPGVEVGSDGKITANGKSVSKILVDGKEFFSDDPTVASKNLPVEMVDKLQVVDRKSDLARLTGVDDGEEETVINLTVKKGMNQGWFGNVEAGYGTDNRYKGTFMINRMWDGNQLTFLGGANNVNDRGFGMGGMSGFRRFGGFNGITTSRFLGVNFNIGNEEIFRVGGDVSYSYSNQDTRNKLNRQYLFTDSTSFENSRTNTLDRSNSITGNFRMEWKPDSFNTLDIRPTMSVNFNHSNSDNFSETFAGVGGNMDAMGQQVNKNTKLEENKGTSWNLGTRIIYNHNVKSHRGRSFSFMGNFNTSNTREKSNTLNEIIYYLLDRDPDMFDQYQDNHTWNNNVSTRLSWTEPLGDVKKGNFLTISYQFSYRWNNADQIVYDRKLPDGYTSYDYLTPQQQAMLFVLGSVSTDEKVDSLSNQFRNNYMNQDIRIGYRHVTKKSNLDVGISLMPQMTQSTDILNSAKSLPERWVWNYAPYLRYRYKMSNSRSINIDYRGRSSQPSISQLQPVPDYSDPLNVIQGNPNLLPSFNHNLNFRFQDFNMEAQRSIMLMLRASMTQNSIMSKVTFDPTTGGRTTTYENVNGIWNVNAFNMISFPLKNKSFTLNNFFNVSYSRNVGFNNGIKNNSDNFGLGESIGFAFRPDNLELELRPNYRLQYTRNSVQTTQNRTTHDFGGSFNFTYYAPFGLVLHTDLTYTAMRGYGSGYDTNEWMLNADISYQFLPSRALTLAISGRDLLDQRSNVSRTVTANYIQDNMYNTLSRYFMVSLTYTFNTFGKGQEPEMRGPGMMGPDGPGGNMRGGQRGGMGGGRGMGGMGGGRRP